MGGQPLPGRPRRNLYRLTGSGSEAASESRRTTVTRAPRATEALA